jgi:hypothetical protein
MYARALALALILTACHDPQPEPQPLDCPNTLVPGCEDAFTPLCDLNGPDCDYQQAGLCREGAANQLFLRRIEPLITEDRPSSCNQCHLSGVNLSLFVQDTPCQAMSCLIAQDLVDLQHPEQSTILTWIKRSKPDSTLITAEISQREHDAFLEWITYSADCHADVCAGDGLICPDLAIPQVDQPAPDDDPADPCALDHESCADAPRGRRDYYGPLHWDCTEPGIHKAFHDVVMPWTTRCAHCHQPEPLIDVGDPTPWLQPGLSLDDSAATLANLERLRALDLSDPAQSPLVRKPLAVAAGGLWHGGGDKYEDTDDPTYRDTMSFLRFYNRCRTQPAQPASPPPLTDAQESP